MLRLVKIRNINKSNIMNRAYTLTLLGFGSHFYNLQRMKHKFLLSKKIKTKENKKRNSTHFNILFLHFSAQSVSAYAQKQI